MSRIMKDFEPQDVLPADSAETAATPSADSTEAASTCEAAQQTASVAAEEVSPPSTPVETDGAAILDQFCAAVHADQAESSCDDEPADVAGETAAGSVDESSTESLDTPSADEPAVEPADVEPLGGEDEENLGEPSAFVPENLPRPPIPTESKLGASTYEEPRESAADAQPEPSSEPTAFVAAPPDQQDRSPIVKDETVCWDTKRVDPAIVVFHQRYSAIGEQYRAVRARLLNMNPKHEHRALLITSSVPQEGKSVTTTNLGMVMAEGGQHTVLIVDADFRRASIARMLGLDSKPGLAELIRNEVALEDILRPTHLPNLKIITAGAVKGAGYGELLGSSRTKSVLDELRRHFEYTFVDTPPVNTVSDVSTIAPHCDGAMIVIEMGRTPEPTVQEAVHTLQTTNVPILGCLLSRHGKRGGYYYYDRYYGYYNKGG